jgi:hypothetical protein
MAWGPTVAEELRNDVRYALGLKVGKQQRPLTDTERDMVAAAIVEHIRSAIGRWSAGRRGVGLRSWGGGLANLSRRRRIFIFQPVSGGSARVGHQIDLVS